MKTGESNTVQLPALQKQLSTSMGGRMAQYLDSIFAFHPAAPGSIPGIPKMFSVKTLPMLQRLIAA